MGVWGGREGWREGGRAGSERVHSCVYNGPFNHIYSRRTMSLPHIASQPANGCRCLVKQPVNTLHNYEENRTPPKTSHNAAKITAHRHNTTLPPSPDGSLRSPACSLSQGAAELKPQRLSLGTKGSREAGGGQARFVRACVRVCVLRG